MIKKSKFLGFTLIELLVAIGTFLIITAIATGSFIRALRTQRATTIFMAINDNAGLILEQMAREIRIGSDFSMEGGAKSGCGRRLDFTAYSQSVSYFLQDNSVMRSTNGVLGKITAENVKIIDPPGLRFCLMGASPGDGMPPRITISMSVGSDYRDLKNVRTNIQTTISARNIDT